MFKAKRIQNFTNRVQRIYGKKFSYIERVLNSCVTLDQLGSAARWASTVMTQYEAYEKRRLNQLRNLFIRLDFYDVVDKYFDLKQQIINLIFERKIKEIEGADPEEMEE